MKEILIILALICTFSMQEVSLFSSNTDNTLITSPKDYYPVLQAYHTKIHPNYIGYGAQWLYKNGGDSWPAGDQATFTAYFYSSCQNVASLVVSADDSFSATVNNGQAMTGDKYLSIYRFEVKNLKCGVNTITVTVSNKGAGTPTAIIFAIVQDQTTCFQCLTSLAYYNRYTCKCQCVDRSTCPRSRPRYVWKNYPVCGCECNTVDKCSSGYYFNKLTCRCECNPTACLPGYEQSLNTCKCIRKCPKVTTCPKSAYWSETQCKCICNSIKKCEAPLYWNSESCECENAMKTP